MSNKHRQKGGLRKCASATPAVHGMVGNAWYHADSGELGYNIEDAVNHFFGPSSLSALLGLSPPRGCPGQRITRGH